jgi:hypothetical protein
LHSVVASGAGEPGRAGAEFRWRRGGSVRLPGGKDHLKGPRQRPSKSPATLSRSFPMTKSPPSRRLQRRRRICRQILVPIRPSRAIMNISVTARLACWPASRSLQSKHGWQKIGSERWSFVPEATRAGSPASAAILNRRRTVLYADVVTLSSEIVRSIPNHWCRAIS